MLIGNLCVNCYQYPADRVTASADNQFDACVRPEAMTGWN